jgi:hypothetical protein
MKSSGLLGAAIVAALAFGAVGVATAAADAELGAASLPAKLTSKGIGQSELKSAAGIFKCSAHSSSGEFTTQDAGKITITFTGCESESVKCKSTGAAAGEIVVPSAPVLTVSLKSGTELLFGVLIQVTPTLQIKCGVVAIELRGSVLGSFPTVVSGTLIDAGTTKLLDFAESSSGGLKQQYETCADGLSCTGTNKLEANFTGTFGPAVRVSSDEVQFSVSVKPTF